MKTCNLQAILNDKRLNLNVLFGFFFKLEICFDCANSNLIVILFYGANLPIMKFKLAINIYTLIPLFCLFDSNALF